MAISPVIIAIVSLVAFYIIIKITKKVILTIFLFFAVAIIALAAIGLPIFQDYQTQKEGLLNGEKLILLVDDSKVLAGLSLTKFDEDALDGILTEEDIDLYSGYYQDEQFDKILEDRFKLIMIKYEFFEKHLKDHHLVEVEGALETELTRDKALSLLKSDDSLQDFIQETYPDFVVDPVQIRTILFLNSFTKITEGKSVLFLVNEYKKDRILVYEDSAILSLMRKIPTRD